MTEITLSNNLIDADEEIIAMKRGKGRPINPARHIDGKHYNGPLDPEHYKNYYHKNFRKEYCCGICGKTLQTSQLIKRHENSAFCLKARYKLENGKV